MVNKAGNERDVLRESRSTSGIRLTTGEKVFVAFNYVFLVLLGIIMVYPFWHVLMYSLSDTIRARSGGVFLLARGMNLSAYKSVLRNPSVWSGFRVSAFVTVSATALATFFNATTAYPISKTRLKGRGFFTFLIFFTMLFSGGMIPTYVLLRSLRMIDTYASLIVPSLLSAWNIFIMRNFFAAIPEALEESARIDGAGDLSIFFRIILPLSKAVLATVALFTAVWYWNDYMSTVLYIVSKEKWSLQAVLRDLLTNTQQAMSQAGVSVRADTALSPDTVKTATVIVATVPILVVYPFLQKYFVKGVMIGSIKG